MKGKLLFLLFLLFGMLAYGQTSTDSISAEQNQTEHLKFKGIEMKGDIGNFAVELNKKGYKILKSAYGGKHEYLMQGMFLDRDCYIFIEGTKKTETVFMLNIYFNKYKNFGKAYNDYKEIKDIYADKYSMIGSNESAIEDSDTEMALRMGRKQCSTSYANDSGLIKVEMKYDSNIYKTVVAITYVDYANMELVGQEKGTKYNDEI